MTASTFAFETPSSLARSARETVDRLVSLRPSGRRGCPSARSAQLGLADAEILGERAELLVAGAAAVEAGAWPGPRPARARAAATAARRAASPR